jgi:hypothetical protein
MRLVIGSIGGIRHWSTMPVLVTILMIGVILNIDIDKQLSSSAIRITHTYSVGTTWPSFVIRNGYQLGWSNVVHDPTWLPIDH